MSTPTLREDAVGEELVNVQMALPIDNWLQLRKYHMLYKKKHVDNMALSKFLGMKMMEFMDEEDRWL